MGKVGRARWFAERAGSGASCFTEHRTIGGHPYRWRSLGPRNVGGRSTAIVFDPRDPQHVLVGSGAGGVWASADGGLKWKPIGDAQPTLNIGALALDPRDPDVLYVGTGEANLNADAYPGLGLYRVSAAGEWLNIGPDLPKRIGAIAVDPHSERGHILVGSASDEPSDPAGLHEGWQNADGTWNWTAISGFAFGHDATSATPPKSSQPYRCHSVLFHPTDKSYYATVNLRGWRSGIWRWRDGAWEQLKRGLPPGEHFGRTSLAIAPSDPNVLWAYAAHRRDGMLGVFMSEDAGDHWHATGVDHFASQRSTYYNNCLAIHPNDPRSVICGGQDLHRTHDRGKHWERITEWDLPKGDRHYAHADHHTLAITPEGAVYDANDGGVSFSPDFGDSWETRDSGLVTTMFYDMDVAPTNAKVFSGGTQDNGTQVQESDKPAGVFTQVKGADGGWTMFHPEDETQLWASSQNVDIAFASDGSFSDVSPSGLTDDETEVWMSYLAMDASAGKGRTRPVFLGTTRIWRTIDDGGSWRPVSPVFDGSTVTAIEVADANPRFVYAGTRLGGFFRSTDGGNTWSENFAGVDLPYRYITRIESHPKNHEILLLTVGATPPKPGASGQSYSHLYFSVDGGCIWRPADSKQLPDVPHNCVTYETRSPFRAFVATDIGVYVGIWNERERQFDWDDLIGNLPNVMVTDLVYHTKTQALFAATYGRGIFRLDLKKPASRGRK